MHLPTRDNVDTRGLLFEDGGLGRAELGIGEIAFSELAKSD
jgi:hypothetical protein